MDFKPLSGRVLVKQDDAAEMQGSLFVPDSSKERPLFGTVLAVSDDIQSLSVNDRVLFGMYSGTEISLEGETLLIMHAEDVMGVMR